MVQIVLGQNAEKILKSFGGLSGHKMWINYESSRYLVKFPGSLSQIDLKDDLKSYSNSPANEHIGSNVYRIFDIPVHHTMLAKFGDKMVVLCRDFIPNDCVLYEYRDVRIQYIIGDIKEDLVKNHSANLNTALDLRWKSEPLKTASGVSMRLFEMITLDGLIGNPDRNNGNWGVLIDKHNINNVILAPVYDNGNCLYNRFSDNKMRDCLSASVRMNDLALNTPLSYFCKDNGKKYSPFKLLKSGQYPLHTLVAKGLFKESHLGEIIDFIYSVEEITEIQKQFYSELIRLRYLNYMAILKDMNVDMSALAKQYGISQTISENTLIDMYRSGVWKV